MYSNHVIDSVDFGFGLLASPTDLKGHGKYFDKFGHICQLIRTIYN